MILDVRPARRPRVTGITAVVTPTPWSSATCNRPASGTHVPRRLRKALTSPYTPARTEAAALEAARVADLVVIPCRPQIYDIETIPATQQLLALAGHPSAVVILNAVPSRGQRRIEQVRTAVARFGLPVCPFTVGHRAAVGDAAALGLTRILCLANVARGLGTAGAVDAGRRYIVVYCYSIVLYYSR